jgi:hypothetical protein
MAMQNSVRYGKVRIKYQFINIHNVDMKSMSVQKVWNGDLMHGCVMPGSATYGKVLNNQVCEHKEFRSLHVQC